MSGYRELAVLAPVAGGGATTVVVSALFNFVRRARGLEQRALLPEELASVCSKFQLADANVAFVVRTSCCLFPLARSLFFLRV